MLDVEFTSEQFIYSSHRGRRLLYGHTRTVAFKSTTASESTYVHPSDCFRMNYDGVYCEGVRGYSPSEIDRPFYTMYNNNNNNNSTTPKSTHTLHPLYHFSAVPVVSVETGIKSSPDDTQFSHPPQQRTHVLMASHLPLRHHPCRCLATRHRCRLGRLHVHHWCHVRPHRVFIISELDND